MSYQGDWVNDFVTIVPKSSTTWKRGIKNCLNLHDVIYGRPPENNFNESFKIF